MSKTVSIDKKVIFRNKDRTSSSPKVDAFSVNNERSIYAFGEDNEDMMKIPFRRVVRRPSSTVTSRSEDEKCNESTKSGNF